MLLAVWWGLFAGLVEVAIAAARRVNTPLMDLGRDYAWMIPLALSGVFLLLGLLVFLTSRLWSRINSRVGTIFLCSSLAFLDLLILVPRLHHLAALTLALGIASQVTRYLTRHMESFEALVRRTLPLLIGAVLVLAVGVPTARILSERRALAAIPPARAKTPNVLLLTLDAVRAPSMSLFGYARRTTPYLEGLAKTGVVFDRALSTAPWTLPSYASMFTGRWYHELSADYAVPLDATYPTLAEYLTARGYATAGFVANLGYCGAQTGLARGFAHYEDYPVSWGQLVSSSVLTRTIANNFRLRRLIRNDEHLNRKTADRLNDEVLKWLDRTGTRPFFVFVNYFDAHDPYLPPAPFDTKFGPGRPNGRTSPLHHWLYDPSVGHRELDDATLQHERDAYDGALAYVDDRLGALFGALKGRGLWDNTLVVITADHGEEFGEHRVFEHGYSLYLPSVHVPLIVSLPGRVPAGKRIQTPITLRDLASTIVDMLDLTREAPFPGRSLARYWETSPAPRPVQEEPLLAELTQVTGQPAWFPASKGNMKSLVFQGMRYIKNGDGAEELYNFSDDPWEVANLAASAAHTATLAQFRVLLARMVPR
jgi:arylsulfatase A-like enzyme